MKLTKVQTATLIAIGAYLVWEVVVWQWAKGLPPSDPVIRVDLLFILPVLAILIGLSLVQAYRNRKRSDHPDLP